MMEIDRVYIPSFPFLSIEKIEYIPSAAPLFTPDLLISLRPELLNNNSWW